jgi:hypothetical protein
MLHHNASSDEVNSQRALDLLTVFSGMINANGRKGGLASLSSLHEYVTVMLLLDRAGSSERVLVLLSKLNVCANPREGRRLISEASQHLSLDSVFRSPEQGKTPVLVFSADNADIKKFGTIWNFIACSAALLGLFWTQIQMALVRAGLYIGESAMREPSEETAADLALSAADEVVLDYERRRYSVKALLEAAKGESTAPPPLQSGSGPVTIIVGSRVHFPHLSREWSGTVKGVGDDTVRVEFTHGNGDVQEITVLRRDVALVSDAGNTAYLLPFVHHPFLMCL